MTVARWVEHSAARLAGAGIESARLEAEILAAHILDKDRGWVVAHAEAEFPAAAGEQLLQRRASREPLAYVLGWREFYGRRFSVDPSVLVPRHETEVTLELALRCGHELREVRAVDVGTGSGCIGITLKLERPPWTLVATDASWAALQVARRNAKDLGAAVCFTQSDLLTAARPGSVDLIVANPPYIDEAHPLEPELSFEPAQALFAGEQGLAMHRRLAREAPGCMASGGRLVVEVGYDQQQAVEKIFEAEGWRVISKESDLNGHVRALALLR